MEPSHRGLRKLLEEAEQPVASDELGQISLEEAFARRRAGVTVQPLKNF